MKYKISIKKINREFCDHGAAYFEKVVLKDKRVIKEKRSIVISDSTILSLFRKFLRNYYKEDSSVGSPAAHGSVLIFIIYRTNGGNEGLIFNRLNDYYSKSASGLRDVEAGIKTLKHFLKHPEELGVPYKMPLIVD